MALWISLTLYRGLFLLVLDVYRGISIKDITDSIKSGRSGDLEDALLVTGQCSAVKPCLQSNEMMRGAVCPLEWLLQVSGGRHGLSLCAQSRAGWDLEHPGVEEGVPACCRRVGTV